MPPLKFQSPEGKVITVDSPDGSIPSEQELDQLFAMAGSAPAQQPPQSIVTNIPGQTEISAPKDPLGMKPMTAEEQGTAQNIGSISRMSGQRISDVASQYEGKTPETGLRRTFDIGMKRDPTLKQLLQGIAEIPMKAAIGAGAVTNPVGTAAGLALAAPVFKGIDYATQKIEENLSEKTPRELKELIGAGGYAGGLALGGKILGKGPGIAKGLSDKFINRPKLMTQATNLYRSILRPTQAEIKNIEIRKGKNVDDYYKLAAEEGIPIKKMADNKIDTEVAREALQPKQEALNNQLNQALSSDRTKKFDLLAIGDKAKAELRNKVKNDTEFKDVSKQVDEYIADAIEARGRMLNGVELNNFKQGMWSKSYDMLKPTANSTARRIGHIAKEAIEQGYPNAQIKALNEKSGQYATLQDLLQNAHGRVVQRGQLGHHFMRTIGAIAGSKIPIAGPIAGAYLGGKASEYMSNPERMSTIAAGKAKKAMAPQSPELISQIFKKLVQKRKP
jgi:hypothetical protein